MKKALLAFIMGVLMGDKTLALISWFTGILTGFGLCRLLFH